MSPNHEDARKGRTEMTVEIRAPIERVYRAFTDVADVREWLKDDFVNDPREGGSFRFGGPDTGGPRRGEYLKLQAPTLLVFNWRWNPMDEGTGKPGAHYTDREPTRVTINLTKQGAATRVHLVHDGFQGADEDYWSYSLGWPMLVGKYMKRYLEDGPEATAAWWTKEGAAIHEAFARDLAEAMARDADHAARRAS